MLFKTILESYRKVSERRYNVSISNGKTEKSTQPTGGKGAWFKIWPLIEIWPWSPQTFNIEKVLLGHPDQLTENAHRIRAQDFT